MPAERLTKAEIAAYRDLAWHVSGVPPTPVHGTDLRMLLGHIDVLEAELQASREREQRLRADRDTLSQFNAELFEKEKRLQRVLEDCPFDLLPRTKEVGDWLRDRASAMNAARRTGELSDAS